MVRHTLKVLQQTLQDFKSVPDHFTILRSKALNTVVLNESTALYFWDNA